MKTIFLKTGTLLLAFTLLFAFTSCDDDDATPAPTLKEKLVGTWDVSSYKVDTSEYMGSIFESASIRYDSIPASGQGSFLQTVKFADETTETVIKGKYSVEGSNTIRMIQVGDTISLKATISGDQLQLDGTQDGEPLRIKSKKR